MTASTPTDSILSSAIEMQWWQRRDLSYREGALYFSDLPVARLAREIGTPGFVYSLPRVMDNLLRLHKALGKVGLSDRFTILYAMKANRHIDLLKGIRKLDLCGIDACSPGEVARAVQCGFDPQQISLTAGSLSVNDFRILSGFPGLFFDADSIHAIRQWGELNVSSEIGIRVNPGLGISRQGNEKLKYAGSTTTKFGVYREQFHEALRVAADAGLRVTKIHFHTGCGYLTEELPLWEEIIGECQWFIEQCDDVVKVNVGGGLGVPHTSQDSPLDLQRWAQVLYRQFGETGLHIEIEPGDYLVKDAGLLLLGKTYMEKKRDTVFLGVDGGFNIAPEPAHYGLPFQPVPVHLDAGPLKAYHVVGNINEALDVWYEDTLLPDMTEEPYLVLINAGAYSASMASDHCMRGEFQEHLLY